MDGRNHTLVIEADGARPTVTKSAAGAAAARLRTEAAILTAARHPGVVSLIGAPEDDADGTCRLRTRFVGSRTLATIGPLTPPRAAALVAAASATVADLHDMGIVHGRLTADHVLVAADGRPVLCGFAEASQGTSGRHLPADDVAALGELLHDLVAVSPPEVEEPPSRRLLPRRPPAIHLRGSLLNLADQATAQDPRRRPTARQLAAALSATVDGPATAVDDLDRPVPDAATSPAPPRRDRPGLSRPALLVGAVAAVVAALALVTASSDPSGDDPPEAADLVPDVAASWLTDPPAPPTTDPTTTTTEPPVPEGAGVDDAAGCAAPGVGGPPSTADGAPCPAEITIDGDIVTIEGTAYRFSTERPAVAVGDFTCDGAIRPAVVDLDRGHVFVFDHWAGERLPGVLADAITTVDSPRQVIAEPAGDGCHRLVVLDTWGLRHEIDVPPPEEPAP